MPEPDLNEALVQSIEALVKRSVSAEHKVHVKKLNDYQSLIVRSDGEVELVRTSPFEVTDSVSSISGIPKYLEQCRWEHFEIEIREDCVAVCADPVFKEGSEPLGSFSLHCPLQLANTEWMNKPDMSVQDFVYLIKTTELRQVLSDPTALIAALEKLKWVRNSTAAESGRNSDKSTYGVAVTANVELDETAGPGILSDITLNMRLFTDHAIGTKVPVKAFLRLNHEDRTVRLVLYGGEMQKLKDATFRNIYERLEESMLTTGKTFFLCRGGNTGY